jgi:hypothetical protein
MLTLAVLFAALPGATRAADWPWSEPIQLSDPQASPNGSFPDLTVDVVGNTHVIWYSAQRQGGEREDRALELLNYRFFSGGSWSAISDLFAVNLRPAIAEANGQTGGLVNVTLPEYMLNATLASGRDGKLHVAVGSEAGLYYLSTPDSSAGGGGAPSVPTELGMSRLNALASADDGSLHVTYRERAEAEPRPGIKVCEACTEIMYRRSVNGGADWSSPINLSRLPGDEGQQQITADGQGRVHVVWDHQQNDPQQPAGPAQVFYRRSLDGGQTWQDAVVMGPTAEGAAQGALGLAPDGNPFVVYRSGTGDEIFFQRSADGGATWSPPGVVPGVRARPLNDAPSDSYSLAADGAGRLHLLVVGITPGDPSPTPKLLHLTWDGQAWSAPRVVMDGPLYPEAPRLVVERGNRLHAVWFTRQDLTGPASSFQAVWYSSAQIDAPEVAPLPLFTPVPSPTVPRPTATPAVVPTPLSAESRRQPVAAGPPSWEGQGLAILSVALAPVALLVLALGWRSLARWHDERD